MRYSSPSQAASIFRPGGPRKPPGGRDSPYQQKAFLYIEQKENMTFILG
jgi:hypothetical protein